MAGSVPFPHWITAAEEIGKNADGESLAVGVKLQDSEAWLIRLSRFSQEWCSVRRALQSELEEYDNLFLRRIKAQGPDPR